VTVLRPIRPGLLCPLCTPLADVYPRGCGRAASSVYRPSAWFSVKS